MNRKNLDWLIVMGFHESVEILDIKRLDTYNTLMRSTIIQDLAISKWFDCFLDGKETDILVDLLTKEQIEELTKIAHDLVYVI